MATISLSNTWQRTGSLVETGGCFVIVHRVALPKERNQDHEGGVSLYVVDGVRIYGHDRPGNQRVGRAPDLECPFSRDTLDCDRDPRRMIYEESSASELNQHQFPPRVGQ